MTKKQVFSTSFNIGSHLLAWVIPLIYIAATYDFLVETPLGRLAFVMIVAIILALRYILYRLKITVDEGYGVEKELAREFRFLIPLGLLLLVVVVIHQNLANLTDVLFFIGIMNIPASFCRIVSYRLSKRYERDISGRETMNLLKAKL